MCPMKIKEPFIMPRVITPGNDDENSYIFPKDVALYYLEDEISGQSLYATNFFYKGNLKYTEILPSDERYNKINPVWLFNITALEIEGIFERTITQSVSKNTSSLEMLKEIIDELP